VHPRKRAMLARRFGDTRMEERARELVVVSTDLRTGEAVHHRRGAVAAAVGASMALPVLLPRASSTAGCPSTGPLSDTGAVGLLEWHQIDAAREAGCRAGRAAIEALVQVGARGG
jgi:predicted acylesterase/phospholipase RssA